MKSLSAKELLRTNLNDRVAKELTRYTNARIAIGHSGGHTRSRNWLKFQADFAAAKDAVNKDIDLDIIESSIKLVTGLPCYQANSSVNSLDQFLTRPDLGRQLSPKSQNYLMQLCQNNPEFTGQDILIVISSGLSSLAVENHATGLLHELLPLFGKLGWSIAPIIISKHTRVAFADKVNDIFKAKLLITLIGERPGLSSNDSMSIYFTYASKINSTDEQRNCISNIHRHGLSYNQAATKLAYLVHRAFTLEYSGVRLKDDFSLTTWKQLLKGITNV